MRRLLLILSALSLVGCDHATKAWAVANLSRGRPMPLLEGVLDLRYAENHDVAFHLMRYVPDTVRRHVILVMGVVLCAVLLVGWWRRGSGDALERWGVWFIVGGAAGNWIDRAMHGHVVDFIHLSHWPIFNVADIAVVIGMGMLAWSMHRQTRQAAPPPV